MCVFGVLAKSIPVLTFVFLVFWAGSSSFFYFQKQGYSHNKLRTKGLVVRASENSGDNSQSVAPLRLESPVGQFLVQMLQFHPVSKDYMPFEYHCKYHAKEV